MSNFRIVLRLALALGLTSALGGCPLAIVGGLAAAGGAGYAANQERGVGGTAKDFSIKTNVQSAWIKEGRTLLTGTAPTPEMNAHAQEIASRVPGVRTVYNEIEVAPPEGAWKSAKDAWITSQVKSDLVFNTHVRSVNYSIETVNSSVYLIGSARSQDELNTATNMARYVRGVKRVVSYVEIRPGEPPGSQPPGTPSSTASEPGPEAPGAAPTTPVEVQKL
jgi:osmotically-inducible protein OsmY